MQVYFKPLIIFIYINDIVSSSNSLRSKRFRAV